MKERKREIKKERKKGKEGRKVFFNRKNMDEHLSRIAKLIT